MTDWDAAGGFATGDDVVGARQAEDRAAMASLGALPVWLDFADHQYLDPADRPTPADVAPALQAAIVGVGPSAVFLPMGLANPDHVLTHDAGLLAREAMAAGRDADGEGVSEEPAWFCYEDAGYKHLPGLLAWRVSKLFRGGLWPTPSVVPVEPDMDGKRTAICSVRQPGRPPRAGPPAVRAAGRQHPRAVLAPRHPAARLGAPNLGRMIPMPDASDLRTMTGDRVPPRGVHRPGTIALVTGASSGIGAATARLLAAGGTTVALVARRADRLEEMVAEDCRLSAPAPGHGPPTSSRPEQAAELALRIWDDLGPIDVVVNNAAIPMRRPAERLTMAEVERVMTVNYYSPVAITLALLPRMLERGSGTIVNVSSMGGRLGIATEAAYSASKFALAGWSESLAIDLLGTGVSVQLVLPGAIRHRDLGPARQRHRLRTRDRWPRPRRAPPASWRVIGSDRFEHYVPDMRAVVEMKTKDIDGFMAAMRAMADADGGGTAGRRRWTGAQGRGRSRPAGDAATEPGREGPAVRRPSRPDGATSGADRRARERLAALPFGLHEVDDARPIHPDWVVTRPILSGVCGSDTKLVLGEFDDGDIDNPMAAFSSLPLVPGHEVVAEVVSLGSQQRGTWRSASGWCSTRG